MAPEMSSESVPEQVVRRVVDDAFIELHAKRLVERARVAQAARAARRERGREIARQIARALGRLGATRVWLFGSLGGEGGLVHERSDIDVAVEGLPAQVRDNALVECEGLAGTEFYVDLVRLDAAPPRLRSRILEHGEPLDVA